MAHPSRYTDLSKPTHTLVLWDVRVTEDLWESLQTYGELRNIIMWDSLTYIIHFYDVRASISAVEAISQGELELGHIADQAMGVSYMQRPPNNLYASYGDYHVATIVIYYMHPGVYETDIRTTCESFGEIKNVRRCSYGLKPWFVEYYDTRHAECAMNTPYLFGEGVRVEFLDGSTRSQNFLIQNSLERQLMHLNFDERDGEDEEEQVGGSSYRYDYSLGHYEEQDEEDDEEQVGESSERYERTTLQIRNIPSKYRQKKLLEVLDNLCLNANLSAPISYDFFYMPPKFSSRKKENRGYAFVNMTSEDAAQHLFEELSEFRWENTSKKCKVEYAFDQGLEANVNKNWNNDNLRVQDNEWLPVTFNPPRNGNQPTEPTPIRWS